MKSQVIATAGGALALTLLQMATGIAFGPMPGPEPPSGAFGWLLLSNVLIAGVLTWFARRSSWTGWRLAAAIFAIAYGIGTFNSLVEAYVFDFFRRPGELQALWIQSLLPALLFAPLLVLLTGRWRRPGSSAAPAPRLSVMSWVMRFAAGSVAYLLLYFAAGMIIFPYVRHFYEQLSIPSPLTVVMLQLFFRGPVFVAIGLLIVRLVPGTRREHALMVAVAMSVLGGMAPLIVPNAYFPDAVRWVHFAEVVSSNLVFGGIVGWLFGGFEPRHEPSTASHTA